MAEQGDATPQMTPHEAAIQRAQANIEYLERLRVQYTQLPGGRELALAITNAQQSKMWLQEADRVFWAGG